MEMLNKCSGLARVHVIFSPQPHFDGQPLRVAAKSDPLWRPLNAQPLRVADLAAQSVPLWRPPKAQPLRVVPLCCRPCQRHRLKLLRVWRSRCPTSRHRYPSTHIYKTRVLALRARASPARRGIFFAKRKKKEKKLRSLLQKNPKRIKGKQGFCRFPLLAF